MGKIIFMASLLFGVFNVAIAADVQDSEYSQVESCSICLEEISNDMVAGCAGGHNFHYSCLAQNIQGIPNLASVVTEGLQCCGSSRNPSCPERFALAQILPVLTPAERQTIEDRLAKEQSAAAQSEEQMQFEIRRLSVGIESAFNIHCPAGCGGSAFDKIVGCNAASCSNARCAVNFCYLCLVPLTTKEEAHTHVFAHAHDYWEHRPGFVERYHWLLARKQLAHEFRGTFATSVRTTALDSAKALLLEHKMWPLPAGLPLSEWLQELDTIVPSLELNYMVEILQNEYIYRLQNNEIASADTIRKRLWALGAPALQSLDVDARQLAPPTRVIALSPTDPRVSQKFSEMGPMLKIQNLIWSGETSSKIGYDNAAKFCRQRDARLPSAEEYRSLAIATGHVSTESFWTNTVEWHISGKRYALAFTGLGASIAGYDLEHGRALTRCVKDLAP